MLVEPGDRGWFTFTGPFTPEVPAEFSMRITGTLVAPETGEWTFGLVQVGRARLTIDGEVVVDNWEPTGRSDAFMGFASAEVTATIELVAGERHDARGRVRARRPVDRARWRSAARRPRRPICSSARSRSRRAPTWSCASSAPTATGRPRATTASRWRCRRRRTSSCARSPPSNPRTVVVVNAASPVEMDWADDVAAVLQCWFAGEEWGHALADVLSGDVSPSGKLPTTFPVRIEDTPAFTSYPGERGQVRYGEGVFVGYRWYDTRRIEPRFCFGHGLSYTTFALDAPRVVDRRARAPAGCSTANACASPCACATPGAAAAPRSCSATCTTSKRRWPGRRRS